MSDFSFNAEDLCITSWSRTRIGSWSADKAAGIKVVHLPTGTTVECDNYRSQHSNRAEALNRLEKKLGQPRLTRLEEVTHGRSYLIFWYNGVQLGALDMDVDGEFYYWPSAENKGAMGVVALKAITSELARLNKLHGIQLQY
jgi:hypothetical protein